MGKIEFIPFRLHHLRLMTLREWDRKFVESDPVVAEYSALMFSQNGAGYTGISTDGIVGCGGAVKVLPGNYELWTYTTPLFPKYALSIHKFTKRYIESFFAQPFVRRLQVLVDATHAPAFNWGCSLFRPNAKLTRLEKYGPEGQDFYIISKVK